MEEKGKKLGLWNIIGLGLGGAIGTGIFVLLGYGIAYTGRSISLVVAIGCFFMLLAYWYNLAMPAMFVMKGGDYSMKAMLFNPFMSGVSAWMILVNGLAMSSYSVALAQYLAIAIPSLQNHQTLVAFIAMTLFFLSTIKGSRFITILENIITLVLVASLVIFVVFGLPKVDFANTFSSADGGFSSGRKLYVEAAVCLCRSVLCARPLDFRQAADRPAAWAEGVQRRLPLSGQLSD